MVSRTVNFLPEYFQTIPNKRFLNSTLDRLVSDPDLERFDGFIGNEIDPQTGQIFPGAYIQESTPFRQNYQLDPAFVTVNGNNTSNILGVANWNDLLNSVENKGGITSEWNRLLTGDQYSWRGFVDIDKIVNFQNYYWVPQDNANSAWYWNNSVIVSNSNISLAETYTITRRPETLKVSGYYIPNPEISLLRGGTYTFDITPDTTSPQTRPAHTITNISADGVTYVTANISNSYFNNTTGWFSNGATLNVTPVSDLGFGGNPLTIEMFVNPTQSGPATIASVWNSSQVDLGAWELIQNSDNTLTFSWVDANSGQVSSISTPTPLSLNEWYYIAITRQAGTFRFYVNGFQIATAQYTGTINQLNYPLTLGAFTGSLSNFRLSNIARYTEAAFAPPTNSLVNDAYTTLLVGFDTTPGSTTFTDDNNVVLSKIWIQTYPGIQGGQTFNPSLSSRNVSGVNNNGITNGQITFTVPTVEANQPYISLFYYGDSRDYVDLATTLEYNQINGQPLSQFLTLPGLGENSNITGHWGGIDGTNQIVGKTVIFVANPTSGWGNVPPNQWGDVYQIGLDANSNLTVTWQYSLAQQYKINITSGTTYRLQSFFKDDTGKFVVYPSAANLNPEFWLQDDSNPNRVLRLNILEANYLPQLDVVQDILGQEFYTAGNGVELKNGMKITFNALTVPAPYNDPTQSWIVEGVGNSIVLVPTSQLIVPEAILLQDNPPDYITINRASLDRNGWSSTNQWVHKDAYNEMQAVLQEQGVQFTSVQPTAANRPILEFMAGLQLFGLGNVALDPATYLDMYTLDAMSNVQGREFYQVDGNQLNQGDVVLFNADKNAGVRSTIFEINFVDTTGNLAQPLDRHEPVQAATTGNINLFGYAVIDGYQTTAGNRILVWQQTNPAENGIYVVNNGIWQRAQDASTTVDFQANVGVFVLNGFTYANKYFVAFLNYNTTVGTTPIEFEAQSVSPVIELVPLQTSAQGNQVLILSGEQYTQQTMVWNPSGQNWTFAPQSKTSLQQYPLFDLFDPQGNSFSNSVIYPQTTFAGSRLFSFAAGNGIPDPVLGFALDYGPIGNLNDIIFDNNYDSDSFVYNTSGTINTVPISNGVAKITNVLTKTNSYYEPWQFVDCNLELYQNLTYTGQSNFVIPGQLLNKGIPNSQPNKVFVDGVQLGYGQFSVTQQGTNILVDIANGIVDPTSTVYIKLLASSVIAGAFYDVPPSFQQNPFNQNFNQMSAANLRQHAIASYSNIDRNINVESLYLPVNLNNKIFNGVPGSLVYNESLSVLPSILLTNSTFDIDQALKTAGEDYLLFKQRFLNTSSTITNIQNLSAKQAVDQIMARLNSPNTPNLPWYTSDMVPVGGNATNYTILVPSQLSFNLKNSYDFTQPNNQAVLVYANNQQLITGQDYEVQGAILTLLSPLKSGDVLSIYEISNTDGGYVPATPTKLGLSNSYVPQIYIDTTYITPQTVIQGHDGSITIAYGDFRDQLLLELELRIFNNLKVNNQLWTDTIEARVPTYGRWRNEQALQNVTSQPYSTTEQKAIYQQLYYEWVATYNVPPSGNYFDPNNTFTWNYRGSLDKFEETNGQSILPGYWRGIFDYFYDTTNPASRPWEMLNLSIMPTWWTSAYGPAPYTGQNAVMWNDIQNGIVRDPAGIRSSSLGTRIIPEGTVQAVLPVDGSGNVLSPYQAVVGTLNAQTLQDNFVFGDGGPVETSWRQSSVYPFAKLRAQILENPLFMCGTLWNLNNYLPTVGPAQFKFTNNQFGSLAYVTLNSVDVVNGQTARVNSLLNYSIEYLRRQGLPAENLREAISNTNVNLVYNMAGFSSVSDLTIYAEQDNPADQGSSVQLPVEDYQLYLNESVPTGSINYSGVIIISTPSGYQVNGYNQNNPFFTVLPSIPGPYTTIGVGSYQFKVYNQYQPTPVNVPYYTVFPTQQAVVDFLASYGQYLTSIGLQFNTDPVYQKVTWIDAAKSFINWSLQNNQTLSLVLNPSSSIIELQFDSGTLQSLTNPDNVLIDVNQKLVGQKFLDVYRDGNYTRITHQAGNVLSGLRANIVLFEHRLIVNNTTIFNDIIYNPTTGLRQNRLRIAGQKTANWNGTLDMPGFMLVTSNVPAWRPNTDYLMGTVVSFKNVNYVALVDVIGSVSFQYNQFTVLPQQFTNSIVPNLSLKARDLTNAYNPYYRNYITDFVKERGYAIGYIERDWLNDLGMDLASQTNFYQGWIKEKGSLNAVNAYGRGSTSAFNTQIDINQEYAFRVGDYGATARTGFGDVQLPPNVNTTNPIVIQFVDQIDPSVTNTIQILPSTLYQKSPNWTNDFVQPQGNIKANQTNFTLAGPVLPDFILAQAQNNVPFFDAVDASVLYFETPSEAVTSGLQENILKVAEHGGFFWLENDPTLNATNNWNVIRFNQANAFVSSINRANSSTLTFNLTADIQAVVNSLVVIDHVDNTNNVSIQGTFFVADYQVAPANNTVGVLTVSTADSSANGNLGQFNTINYNPPFASKTVYNEQSLRAQYIGTANTANATSLFVAHDSTGWASYQLEPPYSTVIAQPNVQGQSPNDGVAYDNVNSLLWISKSEALNNLGRVEYYQVVDETNRNGAVIPTPSLLSSQELTTQRNDTYNLGYVLVSGNNGLVAASARETGSGLGQVYIGSALGKDIQVIQILGDYQQVGYGNALAISGDGNWLFVGSPNSAANGEVTAYMLETATPCVYTGSFTGTTLVLTGNVSPHSEYSLRILVTDPINNLTNQQLIPVRDYTINGFTVYLTNTYSGSATFYVEQLGTFYNFVSLIGDSLYQGQFGASIAADETGSTIAIGAPAYGKGTVDIFQRTIEKTYWVQPISVITTATAIPTSQQIKVLVNGVLLSPSQYTIVGSYQINLNTPTAPDSVVQVETNGFYLLQRITPPNTQDNLFGQSVSIENNQLVVGAPASTQTTNNVTVIRAGRAYYYCLDTTISQTKTVPVSSLSVSGGQAFRINDWQGYLNQISPLGIVNEINALSIYSGMSAALSADQSAIVLTVNNPQLQTTGLRLTNTQPLETQFVLVNTIQTNNQLLNNFGQKVKWLSTDIFAVLGNYAPEYNASEEDVFADGTTFDSSNTEFFDGQPQPTQWLTIYQVLSTNYSWIGANTDLIQIVPVNTVQVSGPTGALGIFDGDITNLWVGNSGTAEETITLYYNPALVHGWTVTSRQEPLLEPRSISRAWIYNSLTNTKLVDLEVADLTTGYLPGALAEQIDYITDIDPAVYDYPQWQPGTFYQIGQRVIYNNTLWQSLNQGRAGSIFNPTLWQQITPGNEFANNGMTKWGSAQVGQIWFRTAGLKVINAQLGNLSQRAADWNKWFPNAVLEIFEWVNSTLPPAQYVGNLQNGFVLDPNAPYTYDSATGLYGFWVSGKETNGPVHNQSVINLTTALSDVAGSGIAMITPIDTNAVAVWNINQYIATNNAILHIDYQTQSAGDTLHSEFVLLSNNGNKTWYTTPLYGKFVDSLVGQTASYQLVPNYLLPPNQQYGTGVNPQQSLFVNRSEALLIYYTLVNNYLANVAVNSSSVDALLTGTTPLPVGGYNQIVPTREILSTLNANALPQNYRVLVESDSQMRNNGWSVVANNNGAWEFVLSQTYDLQAMWQPVDWTAPGYTNATPTFTIANSGELPSIPLILGSTIGIVDNGNGNSAVYKVVSNDLNPALLELQPVFLENGTIQFLPQLYNFAESGIGFDMSPFDTIRYWDDDPYNEIRMITEALNSQILTGTLSNIADDAFFAILNFIIYENQNLDWLFRTSFVSINYPTSNLSAQTTYYAGNAQIVQNFVKETLPYHTRIRQFNDIYNGYDFANIGMSDFDLPAQYDPLYANLLLNWPTNNWPTTLQTSQFTDVGVAVTSDKFYINSSGVPNYTSSANIVEQNWVFAIKLNGAANDSVTYSTANNNVGPIAVATNGVPFYSPNSGTTETLYEYGNIAVSQTFTINTVYADLHANINIGNGVANSSGVFQYLTNPQQMFTGNANIHSPIIGYAFDGNPIYGPYGFANVDGSGGIILQTSGYELSTTPRLDKSNSAIMYGLQTANYATPTGEYIEDFVYNANLGTLDAFNGRFCTTPEYPNGTYAYFTTQYANGSPIYPYVIGPQYWGIPTGLHYEYINGINTPVYTNGRYTMPTPPTISNAALVRSPNGFVSTDAQTIATVPQYAAWANFHTYSVESIDIIQTGLGYVNPVVTIVSSDGNGNGATAVAVVDVNSTKITAINVTNGGQGYTATPVVNITDVNASVQAQAYARLVNNTTRKILTSVRFDRVDYGLEYFNANLGYANGSVVFDPNTNIFFQAVVGNPNANLANTSAWVRASNAAISTSTAINRIKAFYQPTSDMPGNVPSLLMSGLDYEGAYVLDPIFPDRYMIPSGPIHNQDDGNLALQALNASWDPGLMSDTAFSTQIVKFGERSGEFTQNTNTYIQIDSANSTGVNNIALDNSEFTLEFFFRFNALEVTTLTGNVEPANMVLLDTRTYANAAFSDHGLLLFKTESNELAFSVSNIASPIMVGGGITTNVWQFATIQRSGNVFVMYVDGQQVATYNYGNSSQPYFSDIGLTLGTDASGNNICNGFMDELRITANILRYPLNATNIPVPQQAFPRSVYQDQYLTAQYTYILYGFEGVVNESPIQVVFESVNSNTYLQDLSWNNKNMELVNYSNGLVIVNSAPFGNIGTGLGTVLQLGLNLNL